MSTQKKKIVFMFSSVLIFVFLYTAFRSCKIGMPKFEFQTSDTEIPEEVESTEGIYAPVLGESMHYEISNVPAKTGNSIMCNDAISISFAGENINTINVLIKTFNTTTSYSNCSVVLTYANEQECTISIDTLVGGITYFCTVPLQESEIIGCDFKGTKSNVMLSDLKFFDHSLKKLSANVLSTGFFKKKIILFDDLGYAVKILQTDMFSKYSVPETARAYRIVKE